MKRIRLGFALALALCAAPVWAAETYDLIFKTGTLEGMQAEQTLVYRRDVSVPANQDYADRHTGLVELRLREDDMAQLQFQKEDKHRNAGAFPISVGNPIIMYFVETMLRDVAHEAGGSPFYIRNRIKESLLQVVPIEDVTISFDGKKVAARSLTLKPFEDDKNRDRMKGYGDLALTFVMSEEVPGWYGKLEARAGEGEAEVYSYALELLPQEAGQ